MRFLADNDVWKKTIDLLRTWGHEVVTAREVNLSDSSDRELLAKAADDNRLLITRDSDFGALVFLGKAAHNGVILLRITPETTVEVHQELGIVLNKHREGDLRRCFTTVEPGRHRIRKLPAKLDS
jgi:predicted nuclease of predicted toxin-antitoxin system